MINQGLDSGAAPLSTLGSKTGGAAPSKWSINIQEIVKRTQKNLERGPSSSKAGGHSLLQTGDGELQYLSKHMKTGFGSSSTKDKSSLLYHDLKKKLTYESGPQGSSTISGRKDNLLGVTGQNSAKSMRHMSSGNAASS